jgi:hypothetical protein
MAPGDALSAPRSRRRPRTLAYVAAALVVAGLGVALLLPVLACDIYLHHRVQNLGAVNVWGYRGPTVGRPRPGETRIVVLGGSTAFGYGLPWNEAFPYYLEQMLNARATAGARYSVVNLGAPAQGAYGFRFDLADYAYLRYQTAIFYEGYNDLGMQGLPESVPERHTQNRLLWRRQSPVFRATGYFPVLPLVFREKAMALRAGGQLDAAYRGRVIFKPGLATRATAAVLETAAAITDVLGTPPPGALTADLDAAQGKMSGALDTDTWRQYTDSVVTATHFARARGVTVVVVTQPYASDIHIAQQAALRSALTSAFGSDAGVRYVNLGAVVNLRDRAIVYDGVHLAAKGNELIARHLVDPVLDVMR